MDFEWLLSTLFDASLLSTSSRRKRRLFFCSVPFRGNCDSGVLSSLGNYVGRNAAAASGQDAARRAMLTQSYTGPVGARDAQ
jgi:hypothetical protein